MLTGDCGGASQSHEISPADALVRLRAHAISRSLTASEVDFQILNRRLVLDDDDWHDTGGDHEHPARR